MLRKQDIRAARTRICPAARMIATAAKAIPTSTLTGILTNILTSMPTGTRTVVADMPTVTVIIMESAVITTDAKATAAD